MADQKESFGAWSLRRLALPEGASKKLAPWPAALAVVGCLVSLAGFGIAAEAQSGFPFFKVTAPNAAPKHDPAQIVLGVAMVVVGVLGLVPAFRVEDKEADEFWPRSPAPASVSKPLLLMHSPAVVDVEQTMSVLARFGREWPSAEVRWPRSSHLILDALERALKEQHKLDLSHSSARFFLEMAPKALLAAKAQRSRAAAQLPGLVRRCSGFDDGRLADVIRLFLVGSNYEAHERAFTDLGEARELGLAFEAPKSWAVFRHHRDDILYGASGANLWRGLLVSIGGHPVIGPQGPGVWLRAARYRLAHRMPLDGRNALLVAQLEWLAEPGTELPPRYEGEWLFSSIAKAGTGTGFPGDDPGRSTDADIEALRERLAVEWKAGGKGRPLWD